MDFTTTVFLLGGHDLEMVTIKQLLFEHGFTEGKNIEDVNLQWGAKLSEYKHLFNDEQTFVGIELEMDIDPPLHYIRIDHHNENSHKPSSLEQLAELLDITLTKKQQLILNNVKFSY